MSLDSAIYSRLTTGTAIAALVGTRVYPGSIPQGAALPCITYQVNTNPRDHTHDGATGQATARVDVTCHAATHLQAIALAKQVRLRMDSQSGTWDDTAVGWCFLEDESDVYAIDPETQALSRSGRRVDFSICHKDATS